MAVTSSRRVAYHVTVCTFVPQLVCHEPHAVKNVYSETSDKGHSLLRTSFLPQTTTFLYF